jgi:putative endonuclease
MENKLEKESKGAIHGEKRLKGGSRKDKIKLIESTNPDWKDLFSEMW